MRWNKQCWIGCRGESRDASKLDHRQRDTIYLFTVHGDAHTARHCASPHGYDHPEGHSYIERFHCGLKEEEISLSEARENIARHLQEHNHDRPHGGVANRTAHEAFLTFAVLTKNKAQTV